MYQLRNYQTEAVKIGLDYFKSPVKYHAILILPTGSGKSLVIANIAKDLDGNVLVLQPSKELLQQNFEKLASYGFMAGVYSASFNKKEINKITYATIGSIVTKAELFETFKYIIMDECSLVNHKGGMYKNFFENIEGVKVLGVTATPYRLSTDGWGAQQKFLTRTRPKVFSKVLYCVQNIDLFNAKYLSELNYFVFKGFDRLKIKLNSTGADFDDYSLKNYMDTIDFKNQILKVVNKLISINKKSIIVFTKFIHEAAYLSSKIENTSVISSDTPKSERDNIIRSFREGKIKAIFNVGVLIYGFDVPEVEAIVLARPTRSLSLYTQMIGRGTRIHADKKSCHIIDMCGNYAIFGRVEDMMVRDLGREKWAVVSNGKQLTNVIIEENKK